MENRGGDEDLLTTRKGQSFRLMIIDRKCLCPLLLLFPLSFYLFPTSSFILLSADFLWFFRVSSPVTHLLGYVMVTQWMILVPLENS